MIFLESVGAFHMNKILSDHIFKPEDWEQVFLPLELEVV